MIIISGKKIHARCKNSMKEILLQIRRYILPILTRVARVMNLGTIFLTGLTFIKKTA